MRILLHICCGPCALFPLQQLQKDNHEVHGFFHNPNIHPYKEFRRRIDAVRQMEAATGLSVAIDEQYGLVEYLRRVVFHEQQRCSQCYDMRLEQTAQTAVQQGFDAFTSTLLYSRYQNHSLLKEKGETLAKKLGVDFYYQDFRTGWQQGIDESLRLGLYRQPYCGCIYSEQERYDKQLRKKTATVAQASAGND